MARSTLDRSLLWDLIEDSPRRGRELRQVNERVLAAALGWNRATVATAITEFEDAGRLRRWRRIGRSGLVIELLR